MWQFPLSNDFLSNPPKRAYISRNLIALLNYGGVPREYFMNILVDALRDVQGVFSSKRAALRGIRLFELFSFLLFQSTVPYFLLLSRCLSCSFH